MANLSDYIVKDMPNLPPSHPLHYLENLVKRELLPKKPDHDQEHLDMLEHWGLPATEQKVAALTIRRDENGVPYADRMWHLALHMRYWKETDKHKQHVEEFEEKSQLDLNSIPLPK